MDYKEKREEKFVELYTKYRDDMYRCALLILKNDADAQDAVQNAVIKIYEHLDAVMHTKQGKERAYVMAIARNAAYDIYNKNRTNVESYNNALEDMIMLMRDRGSAYSVEEREKERAIHECLKQINEDYSSIIMLYYFEGYSLKKISEIYEITEKSATVRLHRARKAVERVMKQKGYYQKLRKERGEED